MRAIRIKLKQNQAAYNKEESNENKMTYPLPPYSTVIGAIHFACGYEEYHPMDVSVQGKYGSMQREIYVNHGLLNNREDDRNILVYLNNPNLLSAGHIQVGEGLKGQGNSFLNRKTVRIDNEEFYEKYLYLDKHKKYLNKEKNNFIAPKIKELKDKERDLKAKLKEFDKNSNEYKVLQENVKEINAEYKKLDENFKKKFEEEVTLPSLHFRTLVKAPKYQEVLYEVELVIHIMADDKTIEDIKENINNLTCIGRSEDFVELLELKEVELEKPKDTIKLKDGYKMFVKLENIDKDDEIKPFFFVDGENKKNANGTVYYLNKDYAIVGNKRIFNRVACLYSSFLAVDEDSEEVYIDEDGYITDFN